VTILRCCCRNRTAYQASVDVGVRSFSTTSRPALRAAACGGRPRPAASPTDVGPKAGCSAGGPYPLDRRSKPQPCLARLHRLIDHGKQLGRERSRSTSLRSEALNASTSSTGNPGLRRPQAVDRGLRLPRARLAAGGAGMGLPPAAQSPTAAGATYSVRPGLPPPRRHPRGPRHPGPVPVAQPPDGFEVQLLAPQAGHSPRVELVPNPAGRYSGTNPLIRRSTSSSPPRNLTTFPPIAQRPQGLQFVQRSNRLQTLNFPCGGQPDG
jgi:hypothetical protein